MSTQPDPTPIYTETKRDHPELFRQEERTAGGYVLNGKSSEDKKGDDNG
jgi:hypothetical protein